jgi:PAS domain S-box-containing protein
MRDLIALILFPVFVCALISIAGLFCANFLAKTTIAKIGRVVKFAEDIAGGDIPGRLEEGNDELGVVFGAINMMADNLNKAVDAEKAMERRAMDAGRELSLQNARLEILIAERTEELEEAQKHAHMLLDMAEEAVIELNEDGRIKFANLATLRMLGFAEGELLGNEFFGTIKHLHLTNTVCEEECCALRNAVTCGEKTKLFDIFAMGKGGNVIPVSISVSPADPDDPGRGTIVAIIDLTEPRNQLQEILDSSPTTMAVIRDGHVRHVNDNGSITFGLRPGDGVRKIFTDQDQKEKILPLIDKREGVRDYPIKMRGANGEPLDVLFTLHPFEYEGHPSLLEWITDVTDLTKAKTAAEDAAQARTVFLATMSHEIRTPLNAILGLSEAELRNDLPNDTHSNIEKIYSSGSTLLSIINDILDLSKIDSGKFDIIPVSYDFANLISDTIHLNVVRIAGKPVKFEQAIDERTPAKLIGDELRVKQVLNNLLSNSFKYTMKGTVRLEARCDMLGDGVMMTYSVQDTGIGIKPGDIENLFAEYRQFDKIANRKIEGTGLGLFICKNLVEQMGGTIEAESEYGRGSKFTVRIPQGISDPTPIGAETAKGLRTFRLKENRRAQSLVYKPMPYGKVLIVDDVVTNLEVARALMKPYKLTIHCLLGGRQAIETIREGKIEYDAVFMDHVMPEINGIEAVRVIRSEIGTEYAKNVPIIALTANAIAGNEDMFLKNGFQAFLSKPIDVIRLDALLNEWITDKNAPGDASGDISAEAPEESDLPEPAFTIDGLNIEEGVLRQGSVRVYMKILDTYARHTAELLGALRLNGESLREYAVAVHGIKGASLNISADGIAREAEFLERAANEGDYAAVALRNEGFIRSVEKLISDISRALTAAAPAQKETKQDPDALLLRQLLASCKRFDSAGMEKTMSELSKFSYENHTELIEWLTKQAGNLEYDKIAGRLENSEAWINENSRI